MEVLLPGKKKKKQPTNKTNPTNQNTTQQADSPFNSFSLCAFASLY